MGESENDSAASETPNPALVLVDADGNEVEPNESGKSYKYRDFSHVNEDDEEALVGGGPAPAPSRNSSETSIRVQKFPVKLYAILAQKEFHDIITWMPHGRSWKVLKPNIFESMVMPLFFEYSNYHSFNRLVNAWSFRRVSSGPDRGSYYHELFLRGKPHLQKYMRRLPKTHKKLPMQKQDEPDFYQLDLTNPLPALEDAPIPGGLVSSSALNGGVSDKRHDPPAVVSPSESAASCGPSRFAIPQAHRVGTAGLYGNGVPGHEGSIAGTSLQDEVGEVYHQPDQSLSLVPQPSRDVVPVRDTSGSPQMSGRLLQSNSGAFRSTVPPPGTLLSPPRYGASAYIEAAPGMTLSHEQDIGSLAQQQHMSLRSAPIHSTSSHGQSHHVGPVGKLSHMNHMNRMGHLNSQLGYVDPRHLPAGQVHQVSHVRNHGLPPMVNVGYNEISQVQSPHRQHPMNLYHREAAVYGSENLGIMGGINGPLS